MESLFAIAIFFNLENYSVSGDQMMRLRTLIFMLAVVFVCQTAMAQSASWPISTRATTEPSSRAVNFIINRAKDTEGRPLLFEEKKVHLTEFCDILKEQATGLYISSLSTYRLCYPEMNTFGAFDFPFIAKNWADARQVINGPIGLVVSDSLQELGFQVMNFWDGETQVFSSKTLITSADDLKGKKVISPPTFASATVIAQNGGAQVALPGAEVYPALQMGLVEVADVSLGFYAKALTEVQNYVLLSNHSFDPIVVTVPSKTLESLGPIQRGFLESLIRQATTYQIGEARSAQDKNLATLKKQDVNVSVMSEKASNSFRTASLSKASLKKAELMFANAAPALRMASTSQAQGQPIAPYWKVFFATNREATNGKFTKNIGARLLYGQAEVEFDFDELVNLPAELIGKLIRYATKGEGIVVDWNQVSDTPFPKGFAKAPRVGPAKAPLIYVHGFANTFNDALRSAAWIGWNAKRSVVAFTWPSIGESYLLAYRADQQTADRSLSPLALVLEELGRDYDTGTDVDIVAHSMGARVLLGALETLTQKNLQDKPPKFRQLILLAPDVAAAKLHQDWAHLAKYFENNATLYVSDHDIALGISRHLLNRQEGSRAGLAPPVFVDNGIETIFIGPNYFSLTGHSYHVANGIITDDIFELLRYGTSAQERRGSGPSPSGQGYFELRRLKNL